MDVVKKPYYNLTRYIIILSGLSLRHPKWLNFLLKIFNFFTIFSFIGFQIAGFIKVLDNIDMALQCVTPICFSLMSAILYTNNNLKVKQINAVFGKMQTDWDTLIKENEMIILHKYGRKCRTFTTIYIFAFFANCFFYSLSLGIPILLIIMRNDGTPKPLMFFIECGINLQKNYALVIIYSYIAGYVCSYTIANGGTILITFLEHACGIFEILGHKLSTAIKEYPDSINKVSNRKKLHQEIKLCVALHRKLLFAILLSVTGIQCVMSLKHSGDTIRYNADWYHLTTETKQLLIVIMRKGSEPTTFVVGKIFTLSLQFFTKVLQTSMSYFTVLMSVRE
ncbi:uncharacterized protein LOC127285057 isoform X4 [Leptopilina boulardi]|uniref:uncharacterized protein LOC127285057 isoform X4 n=1 Tax=Leptopilina boulardi TaxID=63433 RepID=UPI0021F544D0|nr:uncharacterized protein LOC127285057 isoform X4 [Leptopilina boulardi]